MNVGRGVTNKKIRVEDCSYFDMKELSKKIDLGNESTVQVRWQALSGRTASVEIKVFPPDELQFCYHVTNLSSETSFQKYYVNFVTTECNYGGKRWWFFCPRCKRRCRILYLPYDEFRYACRICHNLTYRSQQVVRNIFGHLIDAVFGGELLINELRRCRSVRKRQVISRKLDRITKNLILFNKKMS